LHLIQQARRNQALQVLAIMLRRSCAFSA
jgi:hypothetical protein